MRSGFRRLARAADLRSTGREEKRRTHRVQAASSLLFGGLALYLVPRCPWLAGLFLLESVGQGLLAWDGERGLAAGRDRVVYFDSTALGRWAAVAVGGGAVLRLFIAFERTDVPALVGLVPVLALVAALVAAGRGGRTDLAMGVFIVLSAVMLGAALIGSGAAAAGSVQLLYAALLVCGVLCMRPWLAEVLNLGVFSAAAFLLEGL